MLLLDTNVVLRYILEPRKLSASAQEAIAREVETGGSLAIAAISLWEIAMLDAKGRVELDSSIAAFLERVQSVYDVLPLTRQIAVRGNHFSKKYPKDPADKQIGATALLHGAQLVTSDEKIRKSGEVSCIW